MQNKLLKDFETFRGSLIVAIFDYVQKAKIKLFFLKIVRTIGFQAMNVL